MSGPPGSGPTEDGESAGMDTLLAQLRQHSKPVNLESSYRYYNERSSFYGQPQSQQSSHSLFLPIDSKVPDGTLPNHNTTLPPPHDTSQTKPGASVASNSDRTSSLLNLLKFSQPSAISATTVTPNPQLPKSSASQTSLVQAPASPPIDTQAYLLQLLNQPKSEISSSPPLKQIIKASTSPANNSLDVTAEIIVQKTREAPLENGGNTTDVTKVSQSNEKDRAVGNVKEPALANKNSGIFTYVNPFDGLAASSPRNRGSKNEKTSSFKPTIQILKNPRDDFPEKTSIEVPGNSSPHNEQKSHISTNKSELSSSLASDHAHVDVSPNAKNSKQRYAAQEKSPLDTDKEKNNVPSKAEKNVEKTRIENQLRDLLVAKSEKDPASFYIEDKGKSTQGSTAHSQVAEHWESADSENVAKEENDTITVYNFPMRPWSSITLKSTEYQRPFFREQAFSEIARLKKDFDQTDRILVTASPNCIAYCMSKNGGIRIIRQSDGRDAKVFTETQDRVFNVIISTSPHEKEAIIGTGISGKVYWTLIKDDDGDHLEENHLQSFGFVLPPLPEPDSETLGTPLKTRTRKSSNHPEFFAVARGKCIFIILPELILKQNFLKDGEKRLVDTDRYLGHRLLKISTGKSGKDFTFSDDDTVIVSLDKSGQIKFWDIRSLTGPDVFNASLTSLVREVQQPILAFNSTSIAEKSSVTSVIFVDKLRPYLRGGPLRYLIVGLKQNHTLQLWDIALRKPVQVVNLPHSNDSDPICSVNYHAGTGMIMVGHPTRNSIYFLHFSAPKYNLTKSLSQAEYMEYIAAGKTLPKPDSTAAISDMREYSLDNKGTLRSLDILQNHNLNSENLPNSADFLFELYCMHSKGVTCIPIHQKDLGWDSENKVVHPVLAEDLDIIKLDSLKENHTASIPEVARSTLPSLAPSRIVPTTSQVNYVNSKDTPGISQSSSEKPARKEYSSHTPTITGPNEKSDKKEHTSQTLVTSGPGPTEKADKKKRRKGVLDVRGPSPTHTSYKMPLMDPSSNVRNLNLNRVYTNTNHDNVYHSQAPASTNELDLKNIEKCLTTSFKKLSQDLKANIPVPQANAGINQDELLRKISTTLNDKVDASISKVVKSSIESDVIPVIVEATARAVQEHFNSSFNKLAAHLTGELERSFLGGISHALSQPHLTTLMSESLAPSVASKIMNDINGLVANNVLPVVSDMLAQNTHKITTEIQRRTSEHINIMEQRHISDSNKIAQLTNLVSGLSENLSSVSEAVTSMATAQAEFQAKFLKMQQQAAQDRSHHNQNSEDLKNQHISRPPSALTDPVTKSREEEEYESMMNGISVAINAGDYENAVIQWLQTQREQEFFMNYFAKFSPDFVRELSPLLLLSLGATISVEFEGDVNNSFLNQRIAWLETILSTFQAHISAGSMDDQVRNLSPKIMGIYRQRFEHLYMRISQVSPHEPILKRLSFLVAAADRIVETSQADGRIHEYGAGLGNVKNGGRHGL